MDDIERRFNGTKRLYGSERYQRFQSAHVCVVGIGGVGSWSVEALARSGVGRFTLIDLDVVAESNTNRQIHALPENFGRAKVSAMGERILAINPYAQVTEIDEFITPENCHDLLVNAAVNGAINGLIDATDQVHAKIALALWQRKTKCRLITVGAAGGKLDPTCMRVSDLSLCTHDPLLAKMRSRLRRDYAYPSAPQKMGVPVIYSNEQVVYGRHEVNVGTKNSGTNNADHADQLDAGKYASDSIGEITADHPPRQAKRVAANLSCSGYGSSVCVTASFGFAAASWLLGQL